MNYIFKYLGKFMIICAIGTLVYNVLPLANANLDQAALIDAVFNKLIIPGVFIGAYLLLSVFDTNLVACLPTIIDHIGVVALVSLLVLFVLFMIYYLSTDVKDKDLYGQFIKYFFGIFSGSVVQNKINQ